MDDEVLYVSTVEVVQERSTRRQLHLPASDASVAIGFHGDVAALVGLPEGKFEPAPATYDLFVATVAGCLTGTFGGALEGRGVRTGRGNLRAEARGELVRTDDGVLVIRRIHVHYRLHAPPESHEGVERAHRYHARACGMARTVADAVDVSTSYELVEEATS
jgi:uncharacterized OsmC-like protein